MITPYGDGSVLAVPTAPAGVTTVRLGCFVEGLALHASRTAVGLGGFGEGCALLASRTRVGLGVFTAQLSDVAMRRLVACDEPVPAEGSQEWDDEQE